MTKDNYLIQIGFVVIIISAFLLGITVGIFINPKAEEVKLIFDKDYMLTSYPVAGEQGHLYIIDFQFSELHEVVDWIKQYEILRRKEGR